jgi:hypothetical protein
MGWSYCLRHSFLHTRKQKYNAIQRYRVPGLTFFAFAQESYDYSDTQVMDYIRHIASAGTSSRAVACSHLVPNVHREISVALVKGHHLIFRARVHAHTRASGQACVPGHLVPTTVTKCISPVLCSECDPLCLVCLSILLWILLLFLRLC